MSTYQELLRQGISVLTEAGIQGAARDARVLMANCLKVDRSRLTLIAQDQADYFTLHEFMVDIRQRAQHVPVSMILGYRDFYDRRFAVDRNVLDPRPETECLVELALRYPFQEVLDLGTGSGCILLTLLAERPNATGVGTDISTFALGVAQKNASALGVEDRVWLTESNWFRWIDGQFDLIVSNPPYIAASEMPDLAPEVRLFDPESALTDGADGLMAYRQIAAGLLKHLTPGGMVLLEIGPTQANAVSELLERTGMVEIATHRDFDGRDRVVCARKPL